MHRSGARSLILGYLAAGLLVVACSSDTTAPAAERTPPALPTSVGEPPADFAQSCAGAFPWGVPLPITFVCFDEPHPGRELNGTIEVRGYIAAEPGSRLSVELRDAGATLVATERVDWRAATPRVLTRWSTTIAIPETALPGGARVTAILVSGDEPPSEAQTGFTLLPSATR